MTVAARICAVGALLLCAQAAGAATQYPVRPIRLVLPIAPGGAVDTTARNIGPRLAERLGQQVVLDNRPGGGGSIGAELTARAAPDGYTVMMASSAFLIHALLYPARYHPLKDFTPVTQLVKHPYVMVVATGVPAASVADFIQWARANPGKANYASSGNGSLIHLTGELFKARTGTPMTHVPYKGIAQGFVDMFAGRVQVTFASVASTLPHVRGGRLRALAVTSVKRVALLPDVPTLDESASRGFEVTQWFGVFAPPCTGREVTARLQREISAVLQEPDQAQRMAAEGSTPVGASPAGFARELAAEYPRWQALIRDVGIKGE